MPRKVTSLFAMALALALAVACGYSIHESRNSNYARKPASAPYSAQYLEQIKPIFDNRCVVCHSCYNSPCQLKLTSYDGLARGATKIKVYDAQRLRPIEPTRLYTDAQTPEEWRTKGFVPVVTEETGTAGQNLDRSMLYRMISHNKDNKVLKGQKFVPEESTNCPYDNGEFQKYAKDNPNGGMPFGFPTLRDPEYFTLVDWIGQGAPGPSPEADRLLKSPSRGELGERIIKDWEDFFNQRDNKSRLVARYLYEHLFLAHIYFKDLPGDFYMLVRSKTPSGHPVVEINTRRPYDNPGAVFFYRLRKISETIVHKTHILYELSDQKRQRLEELFFRNDWTAPAVLPDYSDDVKSNPFIAFRSIPARARYQYMLDDALYFLMTFIKGPACSGNVAVNVINDHFFVFFLDPKADLSVTMPGFLQHAEKHLDHPAKGENRPFASFYPIYKTKQLEYLHLRKRYYKDYYRRGMRITDIWNGDGHNPNAFLTIFRHFDSATVVPGALGGIPKTSLVLDFPVLERLYYSLVAGFDVFGNLAHQSSTRLYMDNLRVEGEDIFLSFLPERTRESLRSAWYQGKLAKAKMHLINRYSGDTFEPDIAYRTNDPKREFLLKVINQHLPPQVRGPSDPVNCCNTPADTRISDVIASEVDLERELRKVTSRSAPFVGYFPSFSLLRVKQHGKEDLIYSVIRNNDYFNISFALFEEARRNPANDTLYFIKGFKGSYPNFFFVVDIEQMPQFLKDIQALPWRMDDKAPSPEFSSFVDKYGVRRSDPKFWEHSDWFNQYFAKQDPLESGILDLNRYDNF